MTVSTEGKDLKTTQITVTVGKFAGEATAFSPEAEFDAIQSALVRMRDAGDVMGLMNVAAAAASMAQFTVIGIEKQQQASAETTK